MKADQLEAAAAASSQVESAVGSEDRGGPLVLALDTSTAVMAAALLEGDRVLGELNSMSERNHSVYSVSALQQLLQQAAKSPAELDAIAAGCGPGSYTGTRIAVTIGKTLAWAWGKPLVGVSSLEGIAYGAWRQVEPESQPGPEPGLVSQQPGCRWLVPLIDARRGQVYTAAFSGAAMGQWERLVPDSIRLMANWADELAERVRGAAEADRPAELIAAGEQLELHSEQLERLSLLLQGLGTQLHTVHYALEGVQIARLGRNRLLRGELSESHALVPNYTQLAEAEAKLAAGSREVPPRG